MLNLDKYGLSLHSIDTVKIQCNDATSILLKCILQELQEINPVKEKPVIKEMTEEKSEVVFNVDNMSFNEMKAFAKKQNISFPLNIKKVDLIQLIGDSF